jgi:hypothetical protein
MKNLLLAALAFVAFNLNAQNITIKAVPQNPVCHGAATGSIDLVVDGGTAPFTYAWSNGAVTPSISGLTAGAYTVTVNDNFGLISTSTIILGEPNQLSATGFVVNCSAPGSSDGSITVTPRGGTPDFAYAWSNGANTKDISNVSAGTYVVTLTDGFGCQTTLTKNVQEPIGPMIIGGIHNRTSHTVSGRNPREVSTDNEGGVSMNVNMFPNPTADFLSVRMNGNEESELTVLNTNGQVVNAQKFNGGYTTVDMSSLPNGNYIVQVKNASGTTNRNISIVK